MLLFLLATTNFNQRKIVKKQKKKIIFCFLSSRFDGSDDSKAYLWQDHNENANH